MSLKQLILTLIFIFFLLAPPLAIGENLRGITVLPGIAKKENVGKSLLGKPYATDRGLVIGINDYTNLPPLIYSVNDAQAIYQMLIEWGFPQNQLHRLINEQATQKAIVAALQDLATHSQPNDRVFIFFAGHGLTHEMDYGEEGFLMPVHSEQTAILKTGISMKTLQVLLKKIPAKHVLVAADSCYSGYAVSRGITVTQNVDHALLAAYTQNPVIQVLTAGQKNQQVTEEQGHGIFTKYLLEGLQGQGDIDGNGLLTALELGQWVQSRVIRKTNRRQIPMFGTLSGEGQYLLRWDLASEPKSQSTAASTLPKFDAWRPPIEEAAGDFKTAYKIANQPRMTVSFLDEVDGQPSPIPLTTKFLESHLQSNGLRTIQAREPTSSASSTTQDIPLSEGRAELSISGKSQTTLSRKLAVEGYDFFFFTSKIQYAITRISTNEIIASATVALPKDEDLSALNREEAARQALERVGNIAATDIQASLHDYWMTQQKEGEIFEVRLQEKSLNKVATFQQSLSSDPHVRDVQRRSFTQEKGSILEIQYQGTQSQFIASIFNTFPGIQLIQEGDHQISLATN